MLRLALIAAVVAATTHAAAADCAMWGLAPRVMNPDAEVPTDGGLVVAAVPLAGGPLDKGDVAVQPSWRWRGGKGLVRPSIEMLAPGLAVYRLPAGPLGAIVIEDAKHAVVAKASAVAARRDRLAAPKVASIHHDSHLGRRSRTQVTVTLDGAPPAGTAVLVLADAKGVPRSWGGVGAASTVTVYLSGDCLALPNGTLPSQPGEQVSVFFVDNLGRKSEASKPITIATTPVAP
jgi:hypothetical protein